MNKALRVLCIVLVLACFMTSIPGVHAATAADLPNEIFLTQEGNGTCTLCSAAMMIRSCLYINGNEGWRSVTETGLKTTAWINGVGLKWNFRYTMESATVEVAHKGVNGFTTEEMVTLLQEHPEGIVLYCGNIPHAVLLTDYTDGVFYCAETVKGYSGERIPLEESWICSRYSTQESALANATAYWYINSYEGITPEACDCTEDHAGTYICTTTSSDLLIRGGHGTSYSVVGYIPAGAEVTVTKASGDGEDDWAHVVYNGVSGYSSMKYLARAAHQHSFETTVFEPTCEGQGYTLHVCTGCGSSRIDSFVDPLGHEFGPWEMVNGSRVHTCTRCGTTETGSANPFVDVDANAYYYDAVLWAYENGITAGRTATEFMPDEPCTRDQVVTFLWRAAGRPEPESSETEFTDIQEGAFYYKAVLWAVEQGITSGLTDVTFGPGEPCTRDQVVTFLWRYYGKPEPGIDNPFYDVEQGKFYYKAVLWAYENGITAGKTATTFLPHDTCTRSQIVTFLYRAMVNQ